MPKKIHRDRSLTEATGDIKEAQEIPEFSRTQLRTFNSKYVDSMDEALAVLDEANRIPVGHTEEEK